MDQPKRTRPAQKFTFSIPPALQPECDGIKAISLSELTANEELLATKRAGGDPMRLALELAREALKFVDGVGVSTADDTIDRALARLGPKGRQLLLTAYARTHAPKNDELDAFLGSCEIAVG